MAPVLIAAALNGARKGKREHPALPLTLDEILAEARACHAAGAAMLHLHVRDRHGGHSLDPGLYAEALTELRRQLPEMLVQITTEAAEIYRPEAQLACLEALRPEFASVAVREIARDATVAARLYRFAAEAGVSVQHILYDPGDLAQLLAWRASGLVPAAGGCNLLFVLGRYERPTPSDPRDLLPFLTAAPNDATWMVCAFGPSEAACTMAALALGGHMRVGFENNLNLPTGERAARNADLVALAAAAARHIACPLADAETARTIMQASAQGA